MEPDESALLHRISADILHIRDRTDRICTTLHGPEGEAAKGIVVRLDRVERSNKTRDARQRRVVGLAVGALVAAASPYVTKAFVALGSFLSREVHK